MIAATTGHRPNKLGGYSPLIDERLRELARRILATLKPEKVVSGMALGWDMAWAEGSLQLGIPLIAAVPFSGQELRWPTRSQKRYREIIAAAGERVVCHEAPYAAWKMQARNEWMVEHCDVLIALWNGTAGGTCNCVRYAQLMNRTIKNVWPVWFAMNP